MEELIEQIISVWTFEKSQNDADGKRALKYAVRIIWYDLAVLLDKLCLLQMRTTKEVPDGYDSFCLFCHQPFIFKQSSAKNKKEYCCMSCESGTSEHGYR